MGKHDKECILIGGGSSIIIRGRRQGRSQRLWGSYRGGFVGDGVPPIDTGRVSDRRPRQRRIRLGRERFCHHRIRGALSDVTSSATTFSFSSRTGECGYRSAQIPDLRRFDHFLANTGHTRQHRWSSTSSVAKIMHSASVRFVSQRPFRPVNTAGRSGPSVGLGQRKGQCAFHHSHPSEGSCR